MKTEKYMKRADTHGNETSTTEEEEGGINDNLFMMENQTDGSLRGENIASDSTAEDDANSPAGEEGSNKDSRGGG